MLNYFQCYQYQCVGEQGLFQNIWRWDFPGDPVVKNPPCNSGDMGSIPGQSGD